VGAERIAPKTGATIIGSYETVRIMAAHGVPETQLLAVSGGERIRLAEGIVLSVFPSLHSCAWSCTSMPQSDAVCLGDLDVEWHEQRDRLAAFKQVVMASRAEVREHLSSSNQGIRGDGGALVFLIETPHGSLFYQDTSGHWTGTIDQLRPDVAILAAAGRGNIDGQPIQGTLAEFVGRQAGLLEPKRILLCHHDNSMPGFSVTTDVGPIRVAIESTVPGAELVEIGYLSSYPLFD
jgi:L-ascorbate metabolism protein UlaG (beta-lactamase superfamily)